MNNNAQIKLDFPMLESLDTTAVSDWISALESFIAEKERLATIKPSKINNIANKGLTLDEAKAKLEEDDVEYSNINEHFVAAVKNGSTLYYKFTDAGSIFPCSESANYSVMGTIRKHAGPAIKPIIKNCTFAYHHTHLHLKITSNEAATTVETQITSHANAQTKLPTLQVVRRNSTVELTTSTCMTTIPTTKTGTHQPPNTTATMTQVFLEPVISTGEPQPNTPNSPNPTITTILTATNNHTLRHL
ncbi:hypothetical protein BCR33DRAFT_390216 [Rhizoclosmatium globosum]|uniref:Uncharacterized protein n=1 Tax=Rhizoclosmatium globosum TaxID=329046 RepID=A0A1Y2BXQ6_9FUNG|nr:hypothetical protein BCR33DRAFT_390216 [Rhizoclosmatium globosum]|eukprot:ORY39526.1 hypothetical protein BCR33DRAFT_390216 [Rhizoclosmatium globosum]